MVAKQQPYISDLTYRPDIDGLRGFAVLSVVVFHAFPNLLRGGFVGVDIFFVISGYLITSIIFKKLVLGNFSFVDFYSRRVRRIFPALLAVLVATTIMSWVVLVPEENTLLGKHTVAAALFVSNFLLWSEAGYFDVASEVKPLLHLWSLGIEEQFYAVAPMLFLILFKAQRRISLILAAIALASFLLNLAFLEGRPVDNFYLPLSRMFELLTGSWLAIRAQQTPSVETKSRGMTGVFASLAGLVLIVGSAYFINPTIHFPGWVVAFPLAGGALLIHAGPNNVFSRYILGNRWAVGLGLISFPLYLWHWPLLTMARMVYGHVPPSLVRGAFVIAAIILAWLTYQFWEKPFRSGRVRHGLAILVGGMVGMILLGLAMIANEGRSPAFVPHLYHKAHDGEIGNELFYKRMSERFYPCDNERFMLRALKFQNTARCFQTKRNEPASTMVVGDSHAEALFPGLALSLADRNVGYYVAGYAPILSNPKFSAFFDEIKNDKNISTVILAAYWSVSTTHYVPNGVSFEAELRSTLEFLVGYGKRVYLMVDIPAFNFDPGMCKYVRFPERVAKCSDDWSFYANQKAEYVETMRSAAAKIKNVKVIDTSNLFCDAQRCSMVRQDDLLYRDNNHLNFRGSEFVGVRLAEEIHHEKVD